MPFCRFCRSFSILEGRLLTTRFSVHAAMRTRFRPKLVRLTLGDHSYAEEIRAWGLRP